MTKRMWTALLSSLQRSALCLPMLSQHTVMLEMGYCVPEVCLLNSATAREPSFRGPAYTCT